MELKTLIFLFHGLVLSHHANFKGILSDQKVSRLTMTCTTAPAKQLWGKAILSTLSSEHFTSLSAKRVAYHSPLFSRVTLYFNHLTLHPYPHS